MQKHVERGMICPSVQGVRIQQAIERVSVSKCKLGKRKLQVDPELNERRLRRDECRLHLEECLLLMDERLMVMDERRIQLEGQSIELERQSIELERQSIENDKQRSEIQISGVLNCVEAMTALDPSWKSDQRMVLQLQDVLTRDILRDYSSGAAGSANTGVQFTQRQRRRRFRSGKSSWK